MQSKQHGEGYRSAGATKDRIDRREHQLDKFGNKTGGRKAGTKNLKTKQKEAASATAVAVATAAVIGTAKIRTPKASLKPRPGMSAKDIMVDAMREAHDAYRAQCIKASEVTDRADAAAHEALALERGNTEKDVDFKARRGLALEAVKLIRQQATLIREAASQSLALALETAHRVAPYDHAKLQTSTVQGEMTLNVTLAKF